MSLILEALRKMEQERRSRRAAGDLRPEVLRYRGEVTQRNSKPYLLVASGVLLLFLGVGAGFLLKGQHGAVVESSQKESNAATAPMATAASPAAVVVEPPAPASPATPASPPVTASPVAPVIKSAPVAAGPAPEVAAAEDDLTPIPPITKPGRGRKAAQGTASPPPRHVQPAVDDVQPNIPDITISGIAWQEERNLRRAVLNGTLVGEGAEVAGARVVEIKENRVRLSRGGHLFDVVFSSGHSR